MSRGQDEGEKMSGRIAFVLILAAFAGSLFAAAAYPGNRMDSEG